LPIVGSPALLDGRHRYNGTVDIAKSRAFQRLLDGPHLDAVVAANRAYLRAAVPDAPNGGGHSWSLSCLPGTRTGRGVTRLSAVNMRTMETFVLYTVEDQVCAFINLRRSVLEAAYGPPAAIAEALDVAKVHEPSYRDAGMDQLQLVDSSDQLVRVLADEHVADAARALADALMTGRTLHWRSHNPLLVDEVLR
jgi:hypothetical protein